MSHVNVVILAAGMGTRLGRPCPKPLAPLADGRTILRPAAGPRRPSSSVPQARITVVVGFKLELVMEAAPTTSAFVYNELYDQTNTGKSLLKALRPAPPGARAVAQRRRRLRPRRAAPRSAAPRRRAAVSSA